MNNREYHDFLASIPGPITVQSVGGKVLRQRRYRKNGISYLFQLSELHHIVPDRSRWTAKSIAVHNGNVWETCASIRSARIYDIQKKENFND